MRRFLPFLLLFFIGHSLMAQLTYETVLIDYEHSYEFKNLKIIPVRKKAGSGGGSDIISLSKALQQGLVTISERGSASTENVHWLRINNLSDKSIFMASGELVTGGRQDRMFTKDTIVAPGSKDQYVPVMCVEEGRWSDKEKKFAYANYANPRLRKVLDQSKNQVLIWKEIYAQLDSNKIKSSTLAYNATRLDKKYMSLQEEYRQFFLDKIILRDSNVVGMICISGDKVIGSDIFDNEDLFYQQFEAMLFGYIEEAINFGASPKLSDAKIKVYLDRFLENEKLQQEYLKKNGKLYKHNGRVIHLTSY